MSRKEAASVDEVVPAVGGGLRKGERGGVADPAAFASDTGGAERAGAAATRDASKERLAAGQTVTAALLGIADERVRNLVRGVLAARSDAAFTNTMESLHRECGRDDAALVGRILQLSPFAKYSGPATAFGAESQSAAEMPFYAATRLDLELAIQSARFTGHSGRLVDAFGAVARINAALLDGRTSDIERLFHAYAEEYGSSMLVAMKAVSLRNAVASKDVGSVDDRPVTDAFLRPRRHVVLAAFEDTSDDRRDYIRARRSFMGFVGRGRLAPADGAMVGDLLSPLSPTAHGLASRLEAYGRRGLVDLTAFLSRTSRLLRRQGREDEAALVDATIPAEVRAALSENFDVLDVDRLQEFVGRKDQFFDLAFFTHLPAWSEYAAILEQRLNVEQAIGRRLDGFVEEGPRTAAGVLRPRSSAREIADELVTPAATRSWIAPDGGFARTVALVASVEEATLATPDGVDLSRLLDRTLNVASIMSVAEIEALLPPDRTDLLYEYMRTALLFDAEGGATRNHALRKAMQNLVQQRHGGDVLAFIDEVDTEDGHVSNHLFNLCSEAFLTTLYGLYARADDVMEAQTRLLEWQGERKDDENAVLQAKSLRLLIRLRKVRGSIEETRIYVDPLRLIEWMHEKLDSELRLLQPLAEEILSAPQPAYNPKDAVTNSVQPRSRLLRLIDQSYEEFCTNKIHGAASYIGRRVRHGTFHGHLAVEMQPSVAKAVDDFASLCPRFADFLRRWMKDFDKAVSGFASDRIHIRSKAKPRGLIVATLDDPDKAAATATAVLGIATALRDKLQPTQVIAMVLDYCWLLIDVDLRRARDAIEDLRREFIIEVEQHLTGRSEIDTRITECVRELNAAVGHRFEVAKSWLTRPTNFSPRASVALMIEAVLDEVRQRYTFRPELDLPAHHNIDLIGHRFHFFYDALYILVDNAAKYGRADGGLGVAIETVITDERRFIDLAVVITSQFRPECRLEQMREIDEAMLAEVGDAMDRDGRTGLRKLRGLVAEADEILSFDRCFEDDLVRFTLVMRYPFS